MKINKKIFLVLFLILFAAALFLVVRPKEKTIFSPDTKTDSQNSVTVEVKPLSLEIGQKPKFEVSFNTHSVELDFDVEKIATFVDDKNNKYGQPKWVGSPPGGHHRSGELEFDKIILKNTKEVFLTFKDIKRFSWKIKN